MGLDEIRSRISENTQKEIERIIGEGNSAASKIIADTKQDLESQRAKFIEETKSLVEQLEKRAVTDSRFEVRKRILEKKKQILAQVFDAVRKELIKMPDSERESWIKKIIEKARNQIDIANVHASSRDMRFLQGYNAEEAAIIGGVIVENSDKSLRIDYSFDAMLEEVKNDTLQEVAKILFD